MHGAASLYACFMHLSSGATSRALWTGRVHIDGVLPLDPADEFVELDRLFSRDQRGVGSEGWGRKSVLAGALSRPAGGSG